MQQTSTYARLELMTLCPRSGMKEGQFWQALLEKASQSAKDFFFESAKSIFGRTLVYAAQAKYLPYFLI